MIDITPEYVWEQILLTMETDNGCNFVRSRVDAEIATRAIKEMMDAGYFFDNPHDLDHSYWQAAAPANYDDIEFFSKAKDAYATLSLLLNEIFDRPNSDNLKSDEIASNDSTLNEKA